LNGTVKANYRLTGNTRSLSATAELLVVFKPGTHWRQSRLLPKPATNRQQSRLLPIRSTSSPVCTRPYSVLIDIKLGRVQRRSMSLPLLLWPPHCPRMRISEPSPQNKTRRQEFRQEFNFMHSIARL